MADQQQSAREAKEAEDRRRMGQRLREAREYLGLSQEFIAEHLHIPRASVSAIENGRRKVSSSELKQLMNLLKQPASAFLDDEGAEGAAPQDETFRALFRAARALSDDDRRQVLRFAQFLKEAGPAPTPPPDRPEKGRPGPA